MAKIYNLQHHADGHWSWRQTDNESCCFYTDNHGAGIFQQFDRDGSTRQLVGTCQFAACKTESGMRKKLNRRIADI